MTLDASGNLGIGTTSPAAKLSVDGSAIFNESGADVDFRVESDTNANAFFLEGSSGNVGIGTSSPVANNSGAKTLQIDGAASGVDIRLTNTATGATASNGSAVVLDSVNFYLWNYENAFTAFGTNSTERMRITSSGYFKASDAGTYLDVSGVQHELRNSANNGTVISTTNASQTANSLQVEATRNTTDNTFYAISYYNRGAAAYRFRVADSGDVTNTNNSYGAISDAKLKENITDASPKLDKLNQVRVVNYNLIGEDRKQLGVIAQELEQIFPSMVSETPDREEDGTDLGTTTKSVKYSVFVPMLIKAMQEQQEQIETLKSEVAALKGA